MARSRRARRTTATLLQRLPGLLVAASVLFATSAALAVGTAWLLDRPVRTVDVRGAFQRVSLAEIEAAVQDSLHGGFLSVDLARLRRRVEQLDWVDRARVQRVWPDSLRVSVTEHVAAARWGERGLLNTRGELFITDARHLPQELPQLSGPDGDEWRVAQHYLDIRGPLIESGFTLVSLALDARGAWRMTLNNGVEVRLGRTDPKQRFERFVGVVTPLLGARMQEISHVDMRYSNGFSVGWHRHAQRQEHDPAARKDPDVQTG